MMKCLIKDPQQGDFDAMKSRLADKQFRSLPIAKSDNGKYAGEGIYYRCSMPPTTLLFNFSFRANGYKQCLARKKLERSPQYFCYGVGMRSSVASLTWQVSVVTCSILQSHAPKVARPRYGIDQLRSSGVPLSGNHVTIWLDDEWGERFSWDRMILN
jgi:hypothetical protein